MTLQAYQRAQSFSETPRAMERRLIAQITGELTAARDGEWQGTALVDAIHRNREMWQAFASMCGASGNQLPAELRAAIISLSLWVDRHSSAVMSGRETLDALIDVNRMIGEGLAQGEPGSLSLVRSHS